MERWPEYTAQGLQGGNGKRTRSVRPLDQTFPQLLGLGHDLWIVSELVNLVDLFVDVTRALLGDTGHPTTRI